MPRERYNAEDGGLVSTAVHIFLIEPEVALHRSVIRRDTNRESRKISTER